MTDTDDKKGDDGQTEPVYGGCEGPNAMYVKLISSDDHEFIINRDYALTSGTIKAMLSGPGKNPATHLVTYLFRLFLVLIPARRVYLRGLWFTSLHKSQNVHTPTEPGKWNVQTPLK